MSQNANLTVPAEYRSTTTDSMTFEARNGRPARTILRALHTFEVEGVTHQFSEELPEKTDLATYKGPVPKGTKVALGLFIEPANVATIVNGKAQMSRGLWRIRVVSTAPLGNAKSGPQP